MLEAIQNQFIVHICPYCFKDFFLSDTPFRCQNHIGCDSVIDLKRKEQWGDDAPLARTADPPFKIFARKAYCESCLSPTTQRICPHCHMDLPESISHAKSMIYAIIGPRQAGKSHYMAVLINRIREQKGGHHHLLLEYGDDETEKRFHDDFYAPVFQQHVPIEPTRSAQDDTRVRKPLIFNLIVEKPGRFGRSRHQINLAFFDSGGEDFDQELVLERYHRYLSRSDGIILVLDPLQLKWVREQIKDKHKLPEVNTATANILTRTAKIIRKGRNISNRRKIPVPFAVVFSKFDAIENENLCDSQMQVFDEPSHGTGFHLADHLAVQDEMQSLLAEWDSPQIISQMRHHFKTHGFFGLSALGCNPQKSQHIPNVVPRRVEDPFLWLLFQNGLLKETGTSS